MVDGADEEDLTPPRGNPAAFTTEELLRLCAERLLNAGNVMLEVEAELEKNTSALIDIKKAAFDIEGKHEQRELGWSFTLEKVSTAHAEAMRAVTDQLAEHTKEIARLGKLIDVSRQLAPIVDAAKDAAKDAAAAKDTAKGAAEVAEKAENSATGTLASIENIAHRMEDTSQKFATAVVEAEESKKDPWYARLGRAFLNAPLRSQAMFILLILSAITIAVVSSALKGALDDLRAAKSHPPAADAPAD